MDDNKKTKKQLINELIELRHKNAELVNKISIESHQEADEKEKTNRDSSESFRALTEKTSDWIWEVDQNGVYTYSSPKVKDLLGYEPNEIIGRTPYDLMPEDETKRISEIFNSIVESRKSFAALENTNLHKDGRRVILETSGVPIFDKDSNFLGYRGIDRDITKRKQAEEELEKSERILSSSFAALDGLLVILDKDFRVLMSNWKDHGFISEEIRHGHPYCYEIFKHMEAPCDFCPPRDTFKDGKFRIYEDKNPVDGSCKEISVSPVLDETGKVTMVIEHVRDITERKRAEKLIDDALTFNKTIIEASPIGIITYKASGQCVSVNESIAKMVGATIDQLLKQNFYHIESWKKSGMLELAEEALATGIEKRKEVYVVSTFGKEGWFACRFVPFQYDDEPHLLTLFADITDRKKAEEEIKRRIKELEEFYDIAIGRELRMKELKEQMEEMKEEMEKLKNKLEKYKKP